MNRSLLNALRAPSRLRIALILLCLLTCTVQSFVAQTHVHVAHPQTAPAAGYSVEAGSAAALPSSDEDEDSPKHVRRDGSASCALCQIVLHGGAAPAPAFAIFLPLPSAIRFAPAEQALPATVVAVSFSWQGRAPPLT